MYTAKQRKDNSSPFHSILNQITRYHTYNTHKNRYEKYENKPINVKLHNVHTGTYIHSSITRKFYGRNRKWKTGIRIRNSDY